MRFIFKILALLTFLSFLCGSQIIGQTASQIECLEVNSDGSIQVTWELYNDINSNFINYQINRKLPGDAVYSQLTTITDINTTSILDNFLAIDANANQYCYQVFVLLTGAPLLVSEDLCSILLGGISDTNTGIVDLGWDDPVPAGSSVPPGTTYEVYYEFPLGNWILDSFFNYTPGNSNYEHQVKVCDDIVNFRVDLKIPGSACSSSSNIIELAVLDRNSPAVPVVTTVSVDSISNLAEINWFTPSAPDVSGYIIYQCLGASAVPFDTIFDPSITTYLDPNSSPTLQPEGYLLASFDDCPSTINPLTGNTSATVPAGATTVCPTTQSSIHLDVSWVVCQKFVDLVWTLPPWGENGIAFYEVFRKENGGAEEFLTLIEEGDREFRDNNILPNQNYQWYIKAHSSSIVGATSLSNIQTIDINSPLLPADFYLSTATVESDDEIRVDITAQPTVDNFEYALLRKEGDDDFFRDIDFLETQSVGNHSFYDLENESSIYSYTYQVALIDRCSDTVSFSNLGKTILLDGIANSESLINTLTWSDYEEWDSGVESYDIFREIDGGVPQLIASNVPNIRFFEDEVTDFLKTKGEFCYQIKASESANPLGNANSISNKLCLTQPPKIWIPNAFTVNGTNDEFKPVISFADFTTYRMIIYNRWGQQLFETQDLDIGWDGTKNGNLLPEDNYMYYIEIQDGAGSIYEERGPLTLLIYSAN